MPKSSGSLEVNFTGLLLIIFVVLKLTHVIAWSWWWVLAPFWVPVGLSLVFLGLMFLIVIAGSI